MSMKQVRAQFLAVGAIAATLLTAGCGGGGGDAPPPPVAGPPPPPASVTISGRAVDGALQGATACYDLNNNNACDAGEPTSGTSDAAGNFSLSVAASDAGQHRVVVNVPSTAIDADTGQAVGAAFLMLAPASGTTGAHSVFVSPLSTLVQRHMDASGQSRTDATTYVQSQAGLAVSPLADFTAAANADTAKAANVAKLALKTSQQQATAVAPAVGQNDVSGTAITQTDLDRAVVARVIGALPALGASAVDAAVRSLTGSAREQALANAAGLAVAQIGFTPEQARFEIGLPRLPQQPPSATPTAGAVMPALQYTDASNWFFRYNAGTAADNTVDANGMLRYYSVRTSMAPYAYQPGEGVATSADRTFNPEMHWTGSAWGDCKPGDRSTVTPRDALGRASYTSCDNHERGTSQRAEIDIGGQTLASVWTNRIVPEVARTTNPASWSLSPAGVGLLGTAVYPAGSRLILQSNTVTETAPTYNTLASNRVFVFSDAVAQGGDARVGTVACSTASSAVVTTSLEEMAARFPGRPCVFNQATNADGTSLNPNESWGPTSVSLGTIANGNTLPAGTANYYNTTARLRVAFTGANNATTYYRCYERRIDASNRNCLPIGSGSYSIATLGDARVMSFANLPAEALGLNFTRVFVERGGAVYYGFKNRVGAASTTVRLNLPAANAMLTQLGMPGIVPTDAPQPLTGAKAATMATARGVWGGADATSALVMRFGNNGDYLLAEVDPAGAGGRPGFERGWLELDPATQQMARLVTLDTNGQWGASHAGPNDGLATITDTAITTRGGESFGRLTDSGTGIVGMWALGSATDLNVTHFVFFANGKVLSIHPAETEGPCATARLGPPGIEWSDYSFNPATGALRFFNMVYDSSGCTGVFDQTAVPPNAEANVVITMASGAQTFTVPVDGGTTTMTAYRIAPR